MSISLFNWNRGVAAIPPAILLANFIMLAVAQDTSPDDAQLAAARLFSSTAALQNGGLHERAATRLEADFWQMGLDAG